MYNRGVVPAIPEQGSVGASGDLAPLAHLALVVIGEGHAFVMRARSMSDGRRSSSAGRKPLSGRAALRRVHLKPYRPQAKEGLSLINGTQISTALLADALVPAWQLARIADIAGAMTVEATKSSRRPFDPRIQAIRPHPGQVACAANLRRLLADSEIMESHADCAKVQDAYSMRCMPQVHGTLRDALTHITAIVEREMNSATDNPLVFADTGEVISGGNFHGQPIALARRPAVRRRHRPRQHQRAARREPGQSRPERPARLPDAAPRPELRHDARAGAGGGAGVGEQDAVVPGQRRFDSDLGQPRGPRVDGHRRRPQVPRRSSTNTHARAGLRSAVRRPGTGVSSGRLRPGRGVEAAYRHIREHVRPLGRDRTLHRDLEAVERLLRSGSLLLAVEEVCGKLE